MFRLFAAIAALTLFSPAAVAGDPAPATQVAPEGVPAPKWLVGDWRLVPPPELKAQIEAMRLVMRDPPPTDEELQALPEDARMMAGMFMMALQNDPDGKAVAEMQAAMDAFEKMRITFTKDGKLAMNLGPQTMETQFVVVDAKPDEAQLSVKGENGGWEQSTVRKGAGGNYELVAEGQVQFEMYR